jgi:hypothetical protein
MGTARKRIALAVAATLVVAVPLLWGDGVDYPDDALFYIVASWEWLQRAAADGLSPWFVTGKLGGVSLFGDVVPMGPFYPASWLAFFLPVVPALGIAILAHAVGTFFAVRWMARVHGAHEHSATLAGAAVVLGPLGSTALIDYQVDTWPTFLWLPLVLGCAERAARAAREGPNARLRWIGMGGLALAAMLLGSHLRVSSAAVGVFCLWVLVRWRDLPGALAIVVLGLIAGAPGYVPMVLEAGVAAQGVAPALLAGQVEQALGLPAVAGWLAPAVLAVGRDISLGTILGVTTLAGIGAGGPAGPRDSLRMGLVVAILILAGSHLPGVKLIFAPLLVLSWPVNVVWPVLAVFPAAILAARGLDRLLALEPQERGRWLRGAASLGLGLLAGASVLRIALGPGTFPSPYAFWLQALSLTQAVLFGSLAVYLLLRPRAGSRLPDLLFALVLADLLLFGVRAHLAVPSTPLIAAETALVGDPAFIADGYLDIQDLAEGFDSSIDEAWSAAADPLESAMAVGASGGHAREEEIALPEADGPAMQADLSGRTWPPHVGMALGVRGLSGRSKLSPERQMAILRPLAEAVHDPGAVAFVLQQLFGHPGALGATTMALHGIPAAVWGDVVAFRIQEVAPLCYAPVRTDLVAEQDERVRRLLTNAGRIDRRPALLEGPLPQPLAEPRAPPKHLSCAEEGLTDVSSNMGALVVRRERWHPGWQVRLQDGTRLETFPVNQVHLGAVVSAGTHRLSYRFVPPGLLPSMASAALGWLLGGLLVLGRKGKRRPRTRRPRPRAAAIAVMLGLAVPTAAGAATIDGTVRGWSPRASYEVWMTQSLDLAGDPPVVRADVEPESGAFSVEVDGQGERWLFLRQRIDPEGGAPFVLFVPWDLAPFRAEEPPERVEIDGISPLMATLRQQGEPVPGWWLVPAFAAILLFGIGLLLRWGIHWQLQTVAQAKMLLEALRRPDRSPPPVEPPLRHDRKAAPRAKLPRPAAPSEAERRSVLVLLLLALALRLRGLFVGSLDLLEHTYGPGTRRIEEVAGGLQGLGSALGSLFPPSSVEVTHPPLYHWSLSILGLFSDAAWLIRLPALAASVATVWLLWLLMRRISTAIGLLAAGLLAVSAPAIHFGHEATPYALIGLVAVASLELLLRALEQGSASAWRRWFALLVVSFLCHYATVFFALAQLATVGVGALLRLRSAAWAGAAHRAIGAGLLLAPIPLAWSLVHFAWFDPVAVDTRLFATVYPRDPGSLTFVARFAAVTCGVAPGAAIAAAAMGLLALRGLLVVYLKDRQLGLLLLGMLAAFFGGVLFFWAEQVRALDGHVFWGFRWVSWMVPPLMALGAAGAVGTITLTAGRRTDGEGSGPGRKLLLGLRGALVLVWAVSALPFALTLDRHTTRPDYAGAADLIAEGLEDRDAVVALPAWGQRGPLTWYLSRLEDGRFTEIDDGVMGWSFGARSVFLEAGSEGFPFESSARNAWFDRLWVVVVDERMFGQPKFDPDVAERAIAWARTHMVLQEERRLDRITLYRFARFPDDLALSDRLSFGPPELDPVGLPWLEPNSVGCQEGEPGAIPSWLLNVRVPLSPGTEPRARAVHGVIDRRVDPGFWSATVEGGPCTGPPPTLHLER